MALDNVNTYQYKDTTKVDETTYSGELAVDTGNSLYTVSGDVITADTYDTAENPITANTLDGQTGDQMKFDFSFDLNLSTLPDTGSRNILSLPGLINVKQNDGKLLFNFPFRTDSQASYFLKPEHLVTGWNTFHMWGDGKCIYLTANNNEAYELANDDTATTNKWYKNNGDTSMYRMFDESINFNKLNSWEIGVHFKYRKPTNTSVTNVFFGTNNSNYTYYAPYLMTRNTHSTSPILAFYVYAGSSTVVVNGADSTYVLEEGAEYEVKCGFTGTYYYMDVRKVGEKNWTRAQYVESTTKSYSTTSKFQFMGMQPYSQYYYCCCDFDWGHLTIYKNGELYYNGQLDRNYYLYYENDALTVNQNNQVGGDTCGCMASSTYDYNGYCEPWYAFNKTLRSQTRYCWNNATAVTADHSEWIMYYTPVAHKIQSFSMIPSVSNRGIKAGYLEASNDNVTFTKLVEFTNASTTNDPVVIDIPAAMQETAYKYFKLVVTEAQMTSGRIYLDQFILNWKDAKEVDITTTDVNLPEFTIEILGNYYPELTLGNLKPYQSWLHLKNINAIKVED